MFSLNRDYYSFNTPLQRDALTPLLKYHLFEQNYVLFFRSIVQTIVVVVVVHHGAVVVAMVEL